jgi:glucose/arabinose dehydrogenase
MMKYRVVFFWLLLFGSNVPACAEFPGHIRLPDGFRISYFSGNVPDARSLALGEQGTVFVSTRKAGKIYALVDKDEDGIAEQRFVIAENLDMPNGVAFHQGALYVAENHRIIRFADIENSLHQLPKAGVIYSRLPTEQHHGWRYLAFGPDGRLYVSIGAPCNICNAGLPFAAIYRMNADGSNVQPYAEGVRNSVGFTWHPESRAMWFTDNGRDWMGDDVPSDELNRAAVRGLHFGYPYRHGKNISDPKFSKKAPPRSFTSPAHELRAHVAPLGLRFYTGSMFPKRYRHKLFIAEHGSWNRSTPVGYRIVAVQVENEQVTVEEVFASGWLTGKRKWGRPVDLLVMPDGSLLVSDDLHGVVYRISYQAGIMEKP